MAGKPVRIAAPGLATLRRDLKKIDRELRLALDRELRATGNIVRDRSRALLRERSKNPRGRIERTIRTSVRAKGVSVYSKHPGAGVVHWGGTIRPRGVPITFERKRFIEDAALESRDDVIERMEDLLDATANRYGFHGV